MRLRIGGDCELHGSLLGLGEQTPYLLLVSARGEYPNVHNLTIRLSRIAVKFGPPLYSTFNASTGASRDARRAGR
jgi:hypothetical protein